MRGAYFQYVQAKGIGAYTDAVEEVNAKRKAACEHRLAERAEQRLARIQNGTHPEYQNGTPFGDQKKKKGKKKSY